MKNKSCQTGMTLIEIMIALLIGVFLLSGLIQIFISSKQAYRMMENQSSMQERGRFAMDFISRDIRSAGYKSCITFTVPTVIAGTNGTSTAPDSITIRMSTAACSTPVANTPVSTIIYTIQTSTSGVGTSLFRNNNGTGAQELIEGVENMQILYGVDTNTTPDSSANYYVPAGTTGLDMEKVISIRVSLLIRSIDDNLADQPIPYTYNGSTTTPTDRRLRRVFNTTIAVRNRLP
jgi:type IV pilus assembly protein PilW